MSEEEVEIKTKEKLSIKSILLKKSIIIYVIVYIAALFILWYLTIPFLNLRVSSSYFFITLILILPVSLVYLVIRKRSSVNDQHTVWTTYKFDKRANTFKKKDVDINQKYKSSKLIFEAAVLTFFVVLALQLIFSMTGAKIFHAKRYYSQLTMEESTKEELLSCFDYEGGEVLLPVIDKDVAFKLAQARLGDFGSQYSIDYDNFTILSVNRNGKTELVRVTPLEYANPFVSLSRMSKGTIGYIEVNVITQETNLIKFDENNGLKYMPSGIFNYDLDRHIRFKYPTVYYKSKYFEIDDSGKPFWVIPTIQKKIGIFSGDDSTGVILVDPISGELNHYKLGMEPSWVQRCVDEKTVEKQANNKLIYKNGFWNTIFSKREVFNLSDGYNYFMKDGNTYYVSCITSPNENDQTSVGFMTINMKTKETKRYYVAGITEMRAREIAMYDERVKAQELNATWPILISYNGVPTYFLVLKNDVQVQKIVFINVDNGSLVAIGNDFKSAKTEYESLLSNQGISVKDDVTVTGVVTAVRDKGVTIEFMIDSVLGEYFVVSEGVSLDARFIEVGQEITVVYKKYETYNYVVSLKKK